jgi:phage FluMu protein Com
MKNCQTMQCIGCSKWLPTLQFATHIEQCCGSSVTSLREKVNPDVNR